MATATCLADRVTGNLYTAQAYVLSDEPVGGAEVFSSMRNSHLAPTAHLDQFSATGQRTGHVGEAGAGLPDERPSPRDDCEVAARHCHARDVLRTLRQWRTRRQEERAEWAYYGDCSTCRHDWREHDPAEGCGECSYEVEHEDPDAPERVCRVEAPGWTA